MHCGVCYNGGGHQHQSALVHCMERIFPLLRPVLSLKDILRYFYTYKMRLKLSQQILRITQNQEHARMHSSTILALKNGNNCLVIGTESRRPLDPPREAFVDQDNTIEEG